MKIRLCGLPHSFSYFLVFYATLVWSATMGRAAQEPQLLDLKLEVALQVKVSFEAKRRALGEILPDLQKQAGIKLMADANSPVRSLVTARVKEMPLSDVLGAFSRLFGVSWTKSQDGGYTMSASPLSEAEMQMLQLGDMNWFRYWYGTTRKNLPENITSRTWPETINWGDEVRLHADYQALRSRAGVPVISLPPDLQQRLRRHVEESLSIPFVRRRYDARQISLADAVLEVGVHSWLVRTTPQGEKKIPSPPQVWITSPSFSQGFGFPLLPPPDEEDAPGTEP